MHVVLSNVNQCVVYVNIWHIRFDVFSDVFFFKLSNQTWYSSLISLLSLVEKKLSCGEISAFHVWKLWGNWKFLHMRGKFRCPHMTDVEKSEILHMWHVCDLESVAIYAKFIQSIAIYAVLLLNLLFMLFCREIFATIYALSFGEKLGPKYICEEKMTNIRFGSGFHLS